MTKSKKPPLWAQQAGWGSFPIQTETLNLIDRLFLTASLIAVAVLVFPHPALAQSASQETPLVFVIENPTYLALKFHNLPAAEEIPEEARSFKNHPEDARVPILNDFLARKGSPAAGQAELILKHKNYRYILAISFAEGNYCRHQIRAYNCWGIGGSNPEVYAGWDQAFTRANDLVQKYHDRGMTNARLMRDTWVGWQNDSWIIAVNQSLAELTAAGL